MKFTRLAYTAFVALTFGLMGGCGSDDEESSASPCAGVSCGNGTCNGTTGQCDCAVGWAGTYCNECAVGYRPEGSACVEAQCTLDAHCSDQVACNGIETCEGGVCRPGTAVDCGEGGFCNEPAGACTCSAGYHLDNGICAANQCTQPSDCDDGLVCNGVETCAGNTCQFGTPNNCGGHGTCQEPSGACECDAGYHNENATCLKDQCTTPEECDDGVACNGTEQCVGGGCTAGTAVTCGANSTCEEPDGTCACDDGFVDDGTGVCVAELEIIGSYTDDWNYDHDITQTEWTMDTSVFHISQYENDDDFLVAQNDAANQYNPDLWSRFDWTLDGTDLYYCQIAFDAATEAAALADTSADRADLATGCAGFEWSKLTPDP